VYSQAHLESLHGGIQGGWPEDLRSCLSTDLPSVQLQTHFQPTKSGFLVANDNYIKFLDDKGPVNFFPGSKINEETSLKMLTDNLRNSDGSLMLMDPSISIPNNLVLRSLPINVELLELLRGSRDCGEPN
jgi:hypothetical protein